MTVAAGVPPSASAQGQQDGQERYRACERPSAKAGPYVPPLESIGARLDGEMDWDAEADDSYPSPRPVAELGPDVLAHGSGDDLGVSDRGRRDHGFLVAHAGR